MTSSSPGVTMARLVGMAVMTLFVVGVPSGSEPPKPVATRAPITPAASVAAGGVTLTTARIELPADEAGFPAGPHADAVNANCTACHSASMALAQPALSAGQWTAEVVKMREVYRAPVAEGDVPAIVAYLVTMPGQSATPALGLASPQR